MLDWSSLYNVITWSCSVWILSWGFSWCCLQFLCSVTLSSSWNWLLRITHEYELKQLLIFWLQSGQFKMCYLVLFLENTQMGLQMTKSAGLGFRSYGLLLLKGIGYWEARIFGLLTLVYSIIVTNIFTTSAITVDHINLFNVITWCCLRKR